MTPAAVVIVFLGHCRMWRTSPHPRACRSATTSSLAPLQGTGEQSAHTRFIDTETFGPFLMV